MTDMDATDQDMTRDIVRTSPFAVTDTFWGYRVRSGRPVPLSLVVGQSLCFFFGACLMTATFGILVLPTLLFDAGLGLMRLGAAIPMAAAGVYMLWFASRGTMPEIHVDTQDQQIREVVCNKSGKPTTIAAYDFTEIGGIFLEDGENSDSHLLLGYLDTSQTIHVATAPEAQLLGLRNRLVHDLLGDDAIIPVAHNDGPFAPATDPADM